MDIIENENLLIYNFVKDIVLNNLAKLWKEVKQ
jgi:hypothetical protein